MKKVKSWRYPYSLGLFYSAVTQRVGLKPNEDEYILMGMAAYGEPIYDMSELLCRNNHKGIGNYLPNAKPEDLAASAQALYENELLKIIDKFPDKQKQAFIKSRFEGKTTKQIAQELKLTPGTVDNYISKILIILRKQVCLTNIGLTLFLFMFIF